MAITFQELRSVFTADITQFEAGIRKIDNLVDGTNAKLNKLGQTTGGKTVGSSLMDNLGLASLSAALAIFGNNVLQTYGRIDGLKVGLRAVMGSAALAKQELERLNVVAKMPGIGFESALEGSIRLQSVGLSANEAARGLSAFGNAIATFGGGKDELQSIQVSLMQIMSIGKVQGREIRELALRIPGIRTAMANAFGTADTEELQKMGISSKQFVMGIINELERLPNVSDNVKNKLENVGDAFLKFKVALGESVNGELGLFINTITGLLNALSGSAGWFRALIANLVMFGAVAAPIKLLTTFTGALRDFSVVAKAVPKGVSELGAVSRITTGLSNSKIGVGTSYMDLYNMAKSDTTGGSAHDMVNRYKELIAIRAENIASTNTNTIANNANTSSLASNTVAKQVSTKATETKTLKEILSTKITWASILGLKAQTTALFSNAIAWMSANAAVLIFAASIAAVVAAIFVLPAIFGKNFNEATNKILQNNEALRLSANAATSAAEALKKYADVAKASGNEKVQPLQSNLKNISETRDNLQKEYDYNKQFLGEGDVLQNTASYWEPQKDIAKRQVYIAQEILDYDQKKKTIASEIVRIARETQEQLELPVTEAQKNSDMFELNTENSSAKQYQTLQNKNKIELEYRKKIRDEQIAAAEWDNEVLPDGTKLHKTKYGIDEKLRMLTLQRDMQLREQDRIQEQLNREEGNAFRNNTASVSIKEANLNNNPLLAATLQAQKDREDAISEALQRDTTSGKYTYSPKLRDAMINSAAKRFDLTMKEANKTEYWRKFKNANIEDAAVSSRVSTYLSGLQSAQNTSIEISKDNFADISKEKQNFSGYSKFMLEKINTSALIKNASGQNSAQASYKQEIAALLEAESNGENITQRRIAAEEKYREAVRISAEEATKYRRTETKELINMGQERVDTIKQEIEAEVEKRRSLAGFSDITEAYKKASTLGMQERYSDPTKIDILGKTREYNSSKDQVDQLKLVVKGINDMITKLDGVNVYS